jgi:hypothetical protein|tara:strand:+ start:315 stop:500 length:186 start_codon:yes stop_codon:yes gene_type:complete
MSIILNNIPESEMELNELNKIWDDWNKNQDIVKTHKAIVAVDWKYHSQGADALLDEINHNS